MSRRLVAHGVVGLSLCLLMGAACPQRFAAVTARPRPVPIAFTMPSRPTCAVVDDVADLFDGAVVESADGNDDGDDAVEDSAAESSAAENEGFSVDRPGVLSRDPVVGVVDAAGVIGVAASLQNPTLLWVLDGRGQLRGVDAVGTLAAELIVEGDDDVALEDVELGPCPDLSGPCIFVADIGDVYGERDVVSVYAIPEPYIDPASFAEAGAVATARYPARWIMHMSYPEGERVHSSGLAVAPDGASIIFFEGGVPNPRAFVADAPWTIVTPEDGDDTNDGPVVLRLLGEIDSDDEVISAQFHWSGQKLVVLGSASLAEYALLPGDAGLLDATLQPEPIMRLELGSRPPSALGYGEDGQSFVALTTVDDDDGAGGNVDSGSDFNSAMRVVRLGCASAGDRP